MANPAKAKKQLGYFKFGSVLFSTTLSLFIVGLFGIILIGTINEQDEEKIDRLGTFCGVIASIVAPIDNSIAILKARDKINAIK